jgi:hypothetical protein
VSGLYLRGRKQDLALEQTGARYQVQGEIARGMG